MGYPDTLRAFAVNLVALLNYFVVHVTPLGMETIPLSLGSWEHCYFLR